MYDALTNKLRDKNPQNTEMGSKVFYMHDTLTNDWRIKNQRNTEMGPECYLHVQNKVKNWGEVKSMQTCGQNWCMIQNVKRENKLEKSYGKNAYSILQGMVMYRPKTGNIWMSWICI